jgi:hypothetical protein
VALGPEQRADIAVQREVGQPGSLDGFDHARVGSMHQVSHLATDLLLPAREGVDVFVDAGVGLVRVQGNDDINKPIA